MKTILVVAAICLVACGGSQIDPMANDAPATVAQVVAPPAGSAHWTFTAFTDTAHAHADVQGSFDVVKTPAGAECRTVNPDGSVAACADLVNLSGTATVGADTGTVTGTEVPSNGIFRAYLDVGGRRLIIIATESGAAFSGFLAQGGANEEVIGASP